MEGPTYTARKASCSFLPPSGFPKSVPVPTGPARTEPAGEHGFSVVVMAGEHGFSVVVRITAIGPRTRLTLRNHFEHTERLAKEESLRAYTVLTALFLHGIFWSANNLF